MKFRDLFKYFQDYSVAGVEQPDTQNQADLPTLITAIDVDAVSPITPEVSGTPRATCVDGGVGESHIEGGIEAEDE
ncbi:hypothetical protein FRB93_012230 [Tulasnella sp. JGI-2019a]|nr:hypothetical protein FRB93_012230 [Tulasnella sp. JGI-2019a]